MNCIATFALLYAALSFTALGQSASTNSVYAAGYLYPAPAYVAPGQVITLFVTGLGQGDISVTVRQATDYPAPVLEVVRPVVSCAAGQTNCLPPAAITIQIPFEIWQPCPVSNACTDVLVPTQVLVTQNGAAGASFPLVPQLDHIHILTECDTVVSNGNGVAPSNELPCPPLVTHGDGSMVTAASPANSNEELVAYAVGLGPTNPAVPTGQAATTPVPAEERFLLDFNYTRNALPAQPIPPPLGVLLTRYATPLFAGLTVGYVGLYQINFLVPPPSVGIAACGGPVQSNLTVSVGGQFSFDGAGICVAPSL